MLDGRSLGRGGSFTLGWHTSEMLLSRRALIPGQSTGLHAMTNSTNMSCPNRRFAAHPWQSRQCWPRECGSIPRPLACTGAFSFELQQRVAESERERGQDDTMRWGPMPVLPPRTLVEPFVSVSGVLDTARLATSDKRDKHDSSS